MTKNCYCEVCEVEFKVSHEMDDESYPILYCPLCASVLDANESYDVETEEES